MQEKLFAKAEELGWACSEDESGGVELGKCSPAGEDFSFYVHDKKELVKSVRGYAVSFDAESHIEMWIMARHSTNGVPDIKTLVEDADAIQEMLNELASALEEVRDDDENRAA